MLSINQLYQQLWYSLRHTHTHTRTVYIYIYIFFKMQLLEWIHPVPPSADSALCFDHALTGQTFSMAANSAILGNLAVAHPACFWRLVLKHLVLWAKIYLGNVPFTDPT